ncbi:hypothetical protein HGM15179_021330 [Zosterops borbonicus]|uniref:Uncharacterized protein n=1 Tax=Zosterops borbonicus TaxID=364589 RepID=A0A8K1D656_9PASS|nr:hypothetical protein HGM15179_021330 [Zosterops borbonicus]
MKRVLGPSKLRSSQSAEISRSYEEWGGPGKWPGEIQGAESSWRMRMNEEEEEDEEGFGALKAEEKILNPIKSGVAWRIPRGLRS